MRHTHRCLGAALVLAASASISRTTNAQTTRAPAGAAHTDARWLPWIGCWSPDSSFGAPSSTSTTCIVPVKGSSAVDALTIAHGKIASHDRLDASGRPHAISAQGCDGSETASWSESERRVFVRSDYVCGAGVKGSSSSIYAFLPTGDWIRAQDVRSGGGSVASADHMRAASDVSIPANVRSLIESADEQHLAATTARAAAAAPINVDEVVDAYRALGAGVVRSWLVEANQRFTLDGPQTSLLAHADLPPSIVQAVMGATLHGQAVAESYTPQALTGEYFNVPGYGGQGAAPQTYSVYTTAPYPAYDMNPYSGSYPYPVVYAAPLLLRHDGEHREPIRHEPPRPKPGPVGVRP